jgi:SH3-like domain-containing protein
MQAPFHAAGLCLLLLAAAPAFGQTTSPPPSNLATQHPAPPTPVPAKPEATKHEATKSALGKPAAAPVIQPHGQAHAQKPAAQKAPAKAAAKPVPPPVAVAPVPAPEPAPAAPAEPMKGSATGNPLPRFAALRTDEVNLRRGPGTRYPIDWLYKRRDLPVEIEREFEVWRLIADPDGVKGWVHQATLTGRRTFIVTGTERVLRRDANDTSAPVARLKAGVIGHIRSCDAGSDWCQMQVGEYRGYLKRDEFWGTLPNEAISN